MVNFKKTVQNLFTARIETVSHYEAKRLYITNSLLFVMAITMVTFAVINLAFFDKPVMGAVALAAAFIPFAGFILLRLNRNLKQAATLATYSVFMIGLVFVYLNQNHNFGLIWSIFLPLFAMILKGPKAGLQITMVYYAILIPMAFSGIGVWQNGEWNLQSTVRFSVASAALVFIIYIYEQSLFHFHAQELKMKKRLENLSRIDELTQIYNRRALNGRLIEEYEKYYRYGYPFSVAILDIDNFKKINDTFGHQVGDIVLKEITRTLTKNFRKTEIIGRWGGEEFMIVFPNTEKEMAFEATEKLRTAIEHQGFTEVGRVTASFGVAQIIPDLTLDDLLAQADKALYEAKKTGKNKVILYENPDALQVIRA